MISIWLVTHTRELNKSTGTGHLVQTAISTDHCRVIPWSRVEPNESLTQLPLENTLLVYPVQDNEVEEPVLNRTELSQFQHFIIIDGTWQQARKMYRQSPYLQQFRKHPIHGEKSQYQLRRNQKNSGLCTAETAIYLLRETGNLASSIELDRLFVEFNRR